MLVFYGCSRMTSASKLCSTYLEVDMVRCSGESDSRVRTLIQFHIDYYIRQSQHASD